MHAFGAQLAIKELSAQRETDEEKKRLKWGKRRKRTSIPLGNRISALFNI